MQVDPNFQKQLTGLDLKALDESTDIVYFLDRDFILRGFNNAWVSFANENGGSPVLMQYPVGASIKKSVPPVLLNFYSQAYEEAARTMHRFDFDFQCSSPEKFRVFHQTVYPLKTGAGVMIMNTLVQTHEHTDIAQEIQPKHFIPNSERMITVCSHCRKTRDYSAADKWDWVPAAFAWEKGNVSHGLCPVCYRFYYHDYLH